MKKLKYSNKLKIIFLGCSLVFATILIATKTDATGLSVGFGSAGSANLMMKGNENIFYGLASKNSSSTAGLLLFENYQAVDTYNQVFKLDFTGHMGLGTSTDSRYSINATSSINSFGGFCINSVCVTDWSLLSGGATGTLPLATTVGQTLRANGTDWVANSVLFNNGTNVGIGITNPSSKLYVNGGTGDAIDAGGGQVHNLNAIPLASSDAVPLGYLQSNYAPLGSVITGPGYAVGYWAMDTSYSISNYNSASVGINTFGTDIGGDTAFAVAQSQSGFGQVTVSSATTTVVGDAATRFTDTFKVGDVIQVGTATRTVTAIIDDQHLTVTPAFTVNGTSGYVLPDIPTGGAARFVVKGSGQVGVGTLDPQASLHISSSATNPSSDVAILVTDAGGSPSFMVNRDGKVGIGSTTASESLSISNGKIFLGDIASAESTANRLYSMTGKLYWDGKPIAGATTTWAISGSSIFASTTSWNVGIGTTAPNAAAKLDIVGATSFSILAGGLKIGSVATPATSTDAATKGYVDGLVGTATFLPLAGGTMNGDIAMGTSTKRNITNVGSLTADKLNVNVIDPLYYIGGINYATFGASFAGGLKEEYTGKATIKQKNASGEYEKIIDFNTLPVGGDLWLWRQVVDFNKDNVEAVITPYGNFASVYYVIENNKLIFRSDRKAEISYRLTGRRFDWRKWPSKVLDQGVKGMEIK